MRRPLFIAMIFLLLLRGWVGDAMATGMAAGHLQQAAPATEFIATHIHESGAGAHFDHEMTSEPVAPMLHSAAVPPDCAGHASGQTSDPLAPEAAGHCESCSACQTCHTVALSPVTASTASLTISPVLPHSPAARFASVIATLGQKPPIS